MPVKRTVKMRQDSRFCFLQAICSSAAYYAEITHQRLADTGYYEEHTPYKTTDEVIAQVEIASLWYKRTVVKLRCCAK